jgi:putative hemolysin
MLTEIFILIILLILSGFFSGIETALISTNMIKTRSLVKQKRKNANTLLKLKQNPSRLIITLLIGNNLVNIGAASLATFIAINLFGSSGVGIATGIMTFLILIFGEITPKTFAAQNATRISLMVAKPVIILSYILFPFVKIFEIISKIMMKILGSKREETLSEEELRTIVTMGKQEGILDKEVAEIMHNVLEFEGTKVTEIMTPDANIEMIDGNSKLKKVLNFIIKTPYSKYPVYLENKDKIVGILDVDDVLKYVKNKKLDIKIKNIARKAYFVPESKEIDDLLTELSYKKTPMAIVVDEYSHVNGIVTVEDILEEIVGEIFDKSKKGNVYIKKINKKITKVNAKAPVDAVNKHLKLGIKEKKFDTIAGFIEHKLQRIPKQGEKIKFKGHIIEIEKVTEQGIDSVKIYKD